MLADTSRFSAVVPPSGLAPHRPDYDFCRYACPCRRQSLLLSADHLTSATAFLRWLTSEIGVAAIPPSCFYVPHDAHLAANLARFCFAKSDEVRTWKSTVQGNVCTASVLCLSCLHTARHSQCPLCRILRLRLTGSCVCVSTLHRQRKAVTHKGEKYRKTNSILLPADKRVRGI